MIGGVPLGDGDQGLTRLGRGRDSANRIHLHLKGLEGDPVGRVESERCQEMATGLAVCALL